MLSPPLKPSREKRPPMTDHELNQKMGMLCGLDLIRRPRFVCEGVLKAMKALEIDDAN